MLVARTSVIQNAPRPVIRYARPPQKKYMPEKEKRAQKLPRAWQAWYKEQEED